MDGQSNILDFLPLPGSRCVSSGHICNKWETWKVARMDGMNCPQVCCRQCDQMCGARCNGSEQPRLIKPTKEELDAKYNIPRDYQKKEGWTDDWHYTELETPAEHGIYYVIHELRNSDHWDYTYMAWFHGYWWAYAGYGNKWLICNDKPREWMIPFAWVEVPDLYYRTDDSYQHLCEIFPSENDWEYEKRMMEIHEENKRWIEEHRGGVHGDV